MKKLGFVLVIIFLGFNVVQGQELESYRIYDSKGKQVDFGSMNAGLEKADVILFGEMHDNPIIHWLQLEMCKARIDGNELVLGAEWFESDNQVVMDEYLAGVITHDHLKKEAKVWPNYKTDYSPIIDFAKTNNLDFIATNIPRRYASLVSKQGPNALDSLGQDSKVLLPALPYSVTKDDEGYERMRSMMGAHGHGMNIDYLIAAQALKDYTMAQNILSNRTKKQQFIHFNGTFHSQGHDGIANYLMAADKKMKVSVIATVEADALDWNEEWNGYGDFLIVTPASMTKTH
ncbi:MAG TPA: iron-regulated protein [Flavobacteriales bacterium]|jgi:uncharacterized iron-regulated protein|nr:ChaN family lipoprotein [Flavobacteriales bacterium]HAW21380.1 iron-regulated protein [Flavobacteriales bacterium]